MRLLITWIYFLSLFEEGTKIINFKVMLIVDEIDVGFCQ